MLSATIRKDNVLLFPRDATVRRTEPVQCRERLRGLLRYYHQDGGVIACPRLNPEL
jgi:hypothetical protein